MVDTACQVQSALLLTLKQRSHDWPLMWFSHSKSETQPQPRIHALFSFMVKLSLAWIHIWASTNFEIFLSFFLRYIQHNHFPHIKRLYTCYFHVPCLVFQRTFLRILHENLVQLALFQSHGFHGLRTFKQKTINVTTKSNWPTWRSKFFAHFTCPLLTTVGDHIKLSNPWNRKIIKDKEFLHLAYKESEYTPSFHLKNYSTNYKQYIPLCVGCDCNFKHLLNAAGKRTIMCLVHDVQPIKINAIL